MKRLKTRKVWGFSPVTRVVKSKRKYNRNRGKQTLRSEL